MSVVFIAGIVIVAIFAAASYAAVRRHEKHDRVLFMFCQLRRDLMAEMRASHDSVSPPEFESSMLLLGALGGIIGHYRRHKTVMFNLRKMRRLVERDLARYRGVQRKVQTHLAAAPPRIAVLYEEFSRAAAVAFVAYTPFIRTEILCRLLWADLAKPIAAIRREAADKLRDEKFA